MCMQPVSALSFKAGKIELDYLQKKDLLNYDNIKLLARQSFCDFLIEKKNNKTLPEYNVIKVLARRKWINPNYVFTSEISVLPRSASPEDLAQKVFETSLRAANTTREKILESAKNFITRFQ